MKRILILITLLFATQQANASFSTGNDLNGWFESCAAYISGPSTDTRDFYACGRRDGYIAGAVDAYIGTGSLSKCVPEHLTLGQLKAVVENWLKSHPEDWHLTANSLILIAVNEAWPCPE